ncbi:translation protein [Trichodelitschia bisporula]|uniref:Large ribosomal subunit protein uL3m n=1 Tax=Trichodelitschia bisporula TaxID=703511 RepID=A0A6G1HTD9_9PEZI|nr:translation protein [Trichodelitschia bisporula]
MPPRPPLTWSSLPALALRPVPASLALRPVPTSLAPHTQTRGIRSILPVDLRLSRWDQDNPHAKSPTALSTDKALERKSYTLPHRTGVIARKKGMTAIYDPETGVRTPCTVLQLDRNQVVAVKTRKKHGYCAVQVGFGWRKPQNCTRPELGHYAKARVAPKEELHEFKVRNEEALLPVGALLGPSWFKEGQFVDTKSNTKGHGFTGGMKRHGFSGQPASHGNSLTHRAMGSAGGSQGSGSRVHPGKKMAGRMGNESHTIQNLKVLKVDEENGIIVVNGCVSGPKNCLVNIQDAKKKPWQATDLGLPTRPLSLETVVEEAVVAAAEPVGDAEVVAAA